MAEIVSLAAAIESAIGAGDSVTHAQAGPADGAPEIAASCREVTVVVRQTLRAFVDRVGGAGPRRIITDLGVLEPDPQTQEFILTGVYAGVTVSEVQDRTGWHLGVAAELARIAPPEPAELGARALVAAAPGRERGSS